jgi:serine O-acetyltransferase
MNDKFLYEYEKATKKKWSFWEGHFRLLLQRPLRYIYIGRKCEYSKSKIMKLFYSWRLKQHHNKYGMTLNFNNIGKGLQLLYAHDVVINPGIQIGNDFVVFRGALIGAIRGGSKNGYPTIGDRVLVCANAVIVGNVKIGNDVLIAANSFVDFDVPDHSLVIGNPGVIHYKENASQYYVS